MIEVNIFDKNIKIKTCIDNVKRYAAEDEGVQFNDKTLAIADKILLKSGRSKRLGYNDSMAR